ncbi:MAG: aminodeoxychorismate synthase component I [Zoogloeaceae bacterium]|nr:aminodeoxychorismate synthase component I [Zoogloeaceae bacterium]
MVASFALLDLPGGGGLLFSDLRETIPVVDAGSFQQGCARAEAAAAQGWHVVAALDYELGYALEPAVKAGSKKPSDAHAGSSLGHFWVFSERQVLDASQYATHLAALSGLPPRPASVENFVPQLHAAAYSRGAEKILDYIAAGDCYQVNLTFPFTGTCIGDPLALYARLRSAQPVACGGLIVTPSRCVLSLSPELFVERHKGRLHARPMKGTAPRSRDTSTDNEAKAGLQASAKDRAENVMIVDLIRNDLGRVAQPGSVVVESLCDIESYPSVHQMTSSVSAACDADLATVLTALFPCGSITGAPKVRAMQIIHELESAPRGLYTGAIGWVGAGGDFSFNVAIRTLQVAADGQVAYGVGSGVVADSQPAAEYAECLLKASFVTQADPGFRLIETLRLEGGAYPLLDLHLARLLHSARALAFTCEESDVRALLLAKASQHPHGVMRVRLTLGRAGDFEVTLAALPPTPEDMQVVVSKRRVHSSDPWLRHKTTVRDVYEAELVALQSRPQVFDALFFNERGELAEGARSSIFLRKAAGQALLTPALTCGVLPGVLRHSLLLSGQAEEAVLNEADLLAAVELYLGNALRGLIPVTLTVT